MTGLSAVGTLLGALLVAVGGGVGSVLRYALDTRVTRRAERRASRGAQPRFPWGITVVNLSGSFALGLLVGALGAEVAAVVGPGALVTPGTLVTPGAASHPAWLALGIGLLGGYTTLSTASLDTVRLARAGRFAAAAGNALGTLGGAVLLAAAGMLLGRALG